LIIVHLGAQGEFGVEGGTQSPGTDDELGADLHPNGRIAARITRVAL
jgi:hypothetical protein